MAPNSIIDTTLLETEWIGMESSFIMESSPLSFGRRSWQDEEYRREADAIYEFARSFKDDQFFKRPERNLAEGEEIGPIWQVFENLKKDKVAEGLTRLKDECNYEFVRSNSYNLQRAAYYCKFSISSGKYEDALRIREAFCFTAPEWQAILSAGIAINICNKLCRVKDKPLPDFQQIFSLSDPDWKIVAGKAYFLGIQGEFLEGCKNLLTELRDSTLNPQASREIECAALKEILDEKESPISSREFMSPWQPHQKWEKVEPFLTSFNFTVEELNKPEVQEAAQKYILFCLSWEKGDTTYANLLEQLQIPDSFIKETRTQERAEQHAKQALANGNIDRFQDIVKSFKLPKEFKNGTEVKEAARKGLLYRATWADMKTVGTISKQMGIPADYSHDDYQSAALKGLKALLRNKADRNDEKIASARKTLHLQLETLTSAEGQQMLSELLSSCASDKSLPACTSLIGSLTPREVRPAVVALAVGDLLKKNNLPELLLGLIRSYCPEEKPLDYTNRFDPKLAQLVKNLAFESFEVAVDFAKKENKFIAFLQREEGPLLLCAADLETVQALHLTLTEAETLLRAKVDLNDILERRDYRQLLQELTTHVPGWKDTANVSGPFKEGAEIFGYRQMFRYADRSDISRHDALSPFGQVIKLFRASGLSASDFCSRILDQVHLDTAPYEDGKSYHHFAAIARQDFPEVSEIISQAREYKNVPMLQELLDELDGPQAVFSSWRSLKRFVGLQKLVERQDLLEKVNQLHAEGKEKLARFAGTLGFHSASNVDLQEVISFCLLPAAFLNHDDPHSPAKVHDQLKPSNLAALEHLDLTAEDLRDCLVEGILDRLQALPPFQMHFTVPKNLERFPDARTALQIALGSRRRGLSGEARSPRTLYKQVRQILEPWHLSPQDFLGGRTVPEEIERQLYAAAFDPEIGLQEPLQQFAGTVHLKSSPQGILAGNDTACCMPFGSGKNNVYMFNLATAVFTVEMLRPDGSRRTIAQSVLTPDRDVGLPFPEVRSQLETKGKHLSEILPPELLRRAPNFLSADNVEVARNFKTPEYMEAIERIYTEFFHCYLLHYQKQLGFVTDRMVLGQSHTDAFTHLESIPNTFVPVAPVGYTDKRGPSVYSLNLRDTRQVLGRVTFQQPAASLTPTLQEKTGVQDLTFRDTLPVAYLESKAYNNDSLILSLFGIQNWLLGEDINNQHKERSNLSLKWVNKHGDTTGYLVAYEGRGPTADETAEGSSSRSGHPLIYFRDIASNPEEPFAAPRLLREFLRRYKEVYLDKGNPLPIMAEMREGTTYEFVKRRLSRLRSVIGVEFDFIEGDTHHYGSDTMHTVLLQPKKA